MQHHGVDAELGGHFAAWNTTESPRKGGPSRLCFPADAPLSRWRTGAGAADTLEALGLNLDRAAETAEETLADIGIGFLFAARHHPAMGRIMPIRKAIGRRTIFNLMGPLANPADRDHCIQYMTAVPLIFGDLVAENYEDDFHAAHPLIDELRDKMQIEEDERYTKDYYDPRKRSIANAVQVFFKDGSCTDKVAVEYPIGHRRRRAEGIPLLETKFKRNLETRFPAGRVRAVFELCKDQATLERTRVNDFMDLLVI